jgi:hypothetical protein
MNMKRILIGGVAAGVAVVVVNFVGFGAALMHRYTDLGNAGVVLKDPRLPFLPLWILVLLGQGLLLSWAYAVARPRLGPGPMTALWVGVGATFFTYAESRLSAASWSPVGRLIPLIEVVIGAIALLVGAQVAGFLYKEEEAKA